MLSAIAIVPSAPVMVPELAGGAAAELTDLTQAACAAAASLPARWVCVGVGRTDAVVSQQVGTFAGYGVDLRVALSPGCVEEPVPLPLCSLVAGWLRGRVKPEAHAEVRVYSPHHDVDAALTHGRRLRSELDEVADPVGLLVVADGAHTLTPPAPGGYAPESISAQVALEEALTRGDADALTHLPDTIVGRVAYQVLAGATEPAPQSAKELYRGAPYGVGYFVGVWLPVGRSGGGTAHPKGRGTTGVSIP